MARSYSCKLIQHNYLKSNGKSSLLLQIIIDRQKSFIKTGIEIQPYLFNTKTGKIKHGGSITKEEAADLNLILDNELAKANEVFVRARLKNTNLSAKLFKELFLKSENISKIDFIEFFKSEILLLKGSRTESTIKTYQKTLNKLVNFRDTIFFNELDKSLIEDFDRFLIAGKLNQSTRGLHHKNFKTFINIAASRGIDFINPYINFKTPRIKGNRVFLSINELKKLIDIYENKQLSKELHNILEYYLFSCYTSLRFSDVLLANSSNISDKMYVYNPVKSSNRLRLIKIPLSDRALKMLSDKKGVLFNVKTNKRTNEAIKEIAECAGINKSLKFHTARHTFATTFLSLGGKLEVLQKIMGHSKIETTMIYVHILEEDMVDQVANFNSI